MPKYLDISAYTNLNFSLIPFKNCYRFLFMKRHKFGVPANHKNLQCMHHEPLGEHHKRIGFTPCFHAGRPTLRPTLAQGGQSGAHGNHHLLPNAPDIVLGVVNIQGRVIPVVNMFRHSHLRKLDTVLSEQLVVAHTAWQPAALNVIACHDRGRTKRRPDPD